MFQINKTHSRARVLIKRTNGQKTQDAIKCASETLFQLACKIYCRLFYERCLFQRKCVCAQCNKRDGWFMTHNQTLTPSLLVCKPGVRELALLCVRWPSWLQLPSALFAFELWAGLLLDLKDDGSACVPLGGKWKRNMQLFAQPNWRDSFIYKYIYKRCGQQVIWQGNFYFVWLF